MRSDLMLNVYANNHTHVHDKTVSTQENNLVLEKTVNAPCKCKVYGNSEQETSVQGKNLFDLAVGTITYNGLTITTGTDGIITINGTNTAGFLLSLSGAISTGNPTAVLRIPLTSGLKYTFSRFVVSGTAPSSSWAIAAADVSGVNYPANYIFNTESTAVTITAGIAYLSGGSTSLSMRGINLAFNAAGLTFSNYKFKIQFEQNTTSTMWEAFVPNKPSLNYISNIKSTADELSLKPMSVRKTVDK